MKWGLMLESFVVRFSLLTTQTKISNQWKDLKLGDVQEKSDDDYTTSNQLSKWINQLLPIAGTKDTDDEVIVRFLTKKVIETTWRLS